VAKRIGIGAGSAEGAALCYRTICAEGAALRPPRPSRHRHPHVSARGLDGAHRGGPRGRPRWPSRASPGSRSRGSCRRASARNASKALRTISSSVMATPPVPSMSVLPGYEGHENTFDRESTADYDRGGRLHSMARSPIGRGAWLLTRSVWVRDLPCQPFTCRYSSGNEGRL
jgi:hypothetical protein